MSGGWGGVGGALGDERRDTQPVEPVVRSVEREVADVETEMSGGSSSSTVERGVRAAQRDPITLAERIAAEVDRRVRAGSTYDWSHVRDAIRVLRSTGAGRN